MKAAVNFILYQLIWATCVLKENDMLYLVFFFLVTHLIISGNRIADLKMMVLLLLIGVITDGSLKMAGFFSFNVAAYPIPLWLASLWMGLAILPHNSLAWMKDKPVLSAIFGGVGGPLAYLAGVQMGAAVFNLPTHISLIILSLLWAAIWPAVMYLAGRIVPVKDPLPSYSKRKKLREQKRPAD